MHSCSNVQQRQPTSVIFWQSADQARYTLRDTHYRCDTHSLFFSCMHHRHTHTLLKLLWKIHSKPKKVKVCRDISLKQLSAVWDVLYDPFLDGIYVTSFSNISSWIRNPQWSLIPPSTTLGPFRDIYVTESMDISEQDD